MKQKNLDALLNIFPVVLSFLIPFFFLPITVEYFEFNKLYLLAVGTGAMLIMWAIKMIVSKEVSVVKSKLDVSLLLLVVAFALSAFFSVSKVASIYGATGRWFPSVFSIITLAFFYYAVSSNVVSERNIKRILYALISGVSVAAVTGMLIYFDTGIISAGFLQQINFSLTGSRASLVILSTLGLTTLIPLLAYTENFMQKSLLALAGIVNLFAVIAFGNVMHQLLLLIAVLVMLALHSKKLLNKANYPFYSVLGSFALLLVLIVNMSGTKDLFKNPKYPPEVTLSLTESWRVSLSALRDFPVLGSGPLTFSQNYTRYKSPSQNMLDSWNLRFDKPYNEILNIVSTTGLVGTAIFALLLISMLRLGLKNKNDLSNIIVGIQIVAIVSLFFTYGTISIMFVLFLTAALQTTNLALNSSSKASKVGLSITSISKSFSILGNDESNVKTNKEVFQYVVAVPLIAFTAISGFFLYKNYMGEYHMRQAIAFLDAKRGGEAYGEVAKAIAYNPRRDTYQNLLARINIALASNLEGKKNITDQDKQTIQKLLVQSISATKSTSERLNPLSVENWQTRAFVYGTLREVAKDAFNLEIQAYNTAIRLDPTNPSLRVAAGGAYYAKKDYLSAGNLFAQAVSLKSDYANAHYNLGFALVNLNSLERARQEFLTVQKLIAKDTPDYKKLTEEIAKLDEKIKLAKESQAVAGASDEKPTVEELQNNAKPVSNTRNTGQQLTEPGTVDNNETINNRPLNINEAVQSTPSGN